MSMSEVDGRMQVDAMRPAGQRHCFRDMSLMRPRYSRRVRRVHMDPIQNSPLAITRLCCAKSLCGSASCWETSCLHSEWPDLGLLSRLRAQSKLCVCCRPPQGLNAIDTRIGWRMPCLGYLYASTGVDKRCRRLDSATLRACEPGSCHGDDSAHPGTSRGREITRQGW